MSGKRITPEQVQQIRNLGRLAALGLTTQRAIAAHMRVSQALVSEICRGTYHAAAADRPTGLVPATRRRMRADLSGGGRAASLLLEEAVTVAPGAWRSVDGIEAAQSDEGEPVANDPPQQRRA